MRFVSQMREWFLAMLPMSRLSAARRAMGRRDYAEAERLYAPLLELNPDQIGVAHSEYGAILGEIAECVLAQGRVDDAEGIVRRGLSESKPGRFTGELLVVLARVLAAKDRWPDACRVLKQAGKVQKRVSGRSSVTLGDMYWDAAQVCSAQSDWRRIVLYLRRARAVYESLPPKQMRHSVIVVLKSQTGALEKLKRFNAIAAARTRIVEMIPNKRRHRAEKARAWEALAAAQILADDFDGALRSIDQGLMVARKLPKAHRAICAGLIAGREELLGSMRLISDEKAASSGSPL